MARKYTSPKFDATKADLDLITKIADRAMALHLYDIDAFPPAERRTTVLMDVIATHRNGNPLRLKDLLAADNFNFAHDMAGICANLDRTTGQLKNDFSPRFSKREV